MNHDSLTVQIQTFANRTDAFFLAQIPDFINQAISRIYCEAKSIGFQKTVQGTFAVGFETIIKPQDWKKTVSLSYIVPAQPSARVYLLSRSYEFCKVYSPGVTQDDPVFYADFSLPVPTNQVNGFIFLSPTPANANQYELVYLSTPLFNTDYPNNFLTDQYPSLLLYACLAEAILFLKNDERGPMIESLYNRALKDILGDTTGRYTDRLSTRDID